MGSFAILRRASQSQRSNTKQLPSLFFSQFFSRSVSQLSSQSQWPSFGIAFDIDGVVLREDTPIGGSPPALRRLYDDSGYLKIPYVFLTNGITRNVLSIDEYASFFEDIDPLAKYKKWTTKLAANQSSTFNKITQTNSLYSQRVQAAFIVSDSVDWSRDIQVLCDILRTGGLPGREIGHQPPLYFAHDDLKYQAAFPSERFGMGAFRIALESIFNRIHPNALEYTSFGKPNPFVFRNAETVLKQLRSSLDHKLHVDHAIDESHFKTVYMVGDNPSVDIKGAKQAGHPWFSILTRTGVFKGKENDADFPADLVVDTVEEAVDYILRKERIS